MRRRLIVERVEGPHRGDLRPSPGASFYVAGPYLVELRAVGSDGWRRITVDRADGRPVDSWADLQAIKDALVGPEVEAAELYPARSRLIDRRPARHLFIPPSGSFPWGLFPSRPRSKGAAGA